MKTSWTWNQIVLVAALCAAVFQHPLAFGLGHSPVALDVTNADRRFDKYLKPYMISLRLRIQRCWVPNTLRNSLRTTVQFEVAESGELVSSQILTSSGDAKFDNLAQSAVKMAAPFKRPPQPDALTINAVFDNRFVNPDDIAKARSEQDQSSKSATLSDQVFGSSPPLPVSNSSGGTQQPMPTLNLQNGQTIAQQPPFPPVTASQQATEQSPIASFGSASQPYLTSPGSPSRISPPKPHSQPLVDPSAFASAPASTMPPLRVPRLAQPPASKPKFSMPPEWVNSGRNGTHHITKKSEDGDFLLLDDGSLWKSEDDSESDGWSDGDEVFVHDDTIINLSQSSEKIDANCEERGCVLVADTHVKGDFEGSDKPITLDNGMIFEATSYHYHYAYHPEALVLSCRYYGHLQYKVIVADDIYDARRLR